MTTKHLIHQFKTAIHDALSSKKDVRAMMRARSGKQRFPVAQWVQDLETLQSTAIARHKKYAERGKRLSVTPSAHSEPASLRTSRLVNYGSQPENTGDISRRFGSRKGPSRVRNTLRKNRNSQGGGVTPVVEEDSSEEETDMYALYGETPGSGSQTPAFRHDRGAQFGIGPEDDDDQITSLANLRERLANEQAETSPLPSGMATPIGHGIQDGLLNPPLSASRNRNSAVSLLSVEGVVGEKQDFNLQKVSPFFTDSTGEYAKTFLKGLDNLTGKNSEDVFCIEEYLSKSEKEWFSRYRDAKLGRSPMGGTPASSVFKFKMHNSPPDSPTRSNSPMRSDEEFPLWKGYVAPSGLKLFLLKRIKDWPLYSILLGFVRLIPKFFLHSPD
jgi:alpha-1,3-glucan synthase